DGQAAERRLHGSLRSLHQYVAEEGRGRFPYPRPDERVREGHGKKWRPGSGLLNAKDQSVFYGKTGGAVVTGNEDGIKHVSTTIVYALQHLGYTIPPQADCGWIGEAGPGPSYGDESED